MPRFCANLTLLFTEYPLVDRIAAARDAGFDAVEILWPDLDEAATLRRTLDAAGIPLALINTPAGDTWGSAARSRTEFHRDFSQTLAIADVLRPRFVHIMAGLASDPEARKIFTDNLRHACDHAPDQQFAIEPISPQTVAGYFLDDFDLAAEIISDVNRPNLSLQLDMFHAHNMTGDAPALWQRMKPHTAHIQIAGVPDRHEPIGGDLDYPTLFAQLDADGYGGFVSAEYHPKGRTEDGLTWLPKIPELS
ncbi:hydroxypyruvate isomerase family protein [Aliiroseovarius sp. YM-037]|uniref:hydroxypyruvate isomerase family protein n=1 Tax=Aliiroseovarius sp. YM-037 TaxID=3341728 RepID=UPI003A7FF782